MPECRETHWVEKFVYRLSSNDGEGWMKPHLSSLNLIDFTNESGTLPKILGDGEIRISGAGTINRMVKIQMRSAGLLPNLLLTGCIVATKQTVCFTATQSRENQIGNSYEIEWRDESKRLLAVETMPRRAKVSAFIGGGSSTVASASGWRGLPRLEMKVVLDRDMFDLLVTCWIARFRRIESIYS